MESNRLREIFDGLEVKQYPITLLLCIFIILNCVFSFSNFINTGSHDDQRLLQIILILISTAAIVLYKIPLKIIQLSWLRLFVFLFFLLGIVSGIGALSLRFAFYEVASLFFLSVLSLYIANEVSKRGFRSINWILMICAVGCMLYAFRFLTVYIAVLVLGIQPDVMNLVPGFSNYRFLNHTQTIALPLLILYFLLEKKETKASLMHMIFVGFWWSLLFMTGGRGTIVGLLAGAGIAYMVQPKYAITFCKGMLTTGMVGVVIYAILFMLVPFLVGLHPFGVFFQLAQRSIEDPTSGRLLLWQRALELIFSNPWVGVGPMHFAHYGADINNGAHPHNLILQIGAEWGVPALLCLCIAISIGMRNLFRAVYMISASDIRNQTIFSAWIVIGVAILVDSQFSGLVVMPFSQLLIVLYVGCAMGWSRSISDNEISQKVSPSWSRWLFQSFLILISVCGILYGALPKMDILFGLKTELTRESLSHPRALHPRIWTDGNF
ncbi:O-antigen ligase [Collimonas sp. OK307]|uniref:O-antigen ligase family protein n=1 Tax=Collimonas sp. OK307 TaxID=1801620 RepID=UPI0008E1D80F|nr:O-antigen ligase family protein [Collimonas sp. OK307]SFI08474.1 O-antigen ligase [Collimonas sp. OK307]